MGMHAQTYTHMYSGMREREENGINGITLDFDHSIMFFFLIFPIFCSLERGVDLSRQFISSEYRIHFLKVMFHDIRLLWKKSERNISHGSSLVALLLLPLTFSRLFVLHLWEFIFLIFKSEMGLQKEDVLPILGVKTSYITAAKIF